MIYIAVLLIVGVAYYFLILNKEKEEVIDDQDFE